MSIFRLGVLAALSSTLFATACTSRLSRFDVIHTRKPTGQSEIVVSEIAAQGSGNAVSSGHVLRGVTIGGSYMRRVVTTGAGTQVRAGLPTTR